ncbi:MAG: AMP-dependent synthetase/ligase [Myxococcota bacterium]
MSVAANIEPESKSETSDLDLTLPGRLREFARSRPDAPALREKQLGIWQQISWQTYYENCAAVGRMLWHLGIRRGDHISILSDNRPEWLYADIGAQGIQARSAGIYQTNPAEDVAYILNDSNSKIIFCEDQEQVDKAIEVKDDTEQVRHVIVFDPRGTRDYSDRRIMTFSDFVAKGRELLSDDPEWFDRKVDELDPDDVSMIIYTSGTTGPPKGAMISSRNALQTGREIIPMLGVTEDDTILSYLPLCHVAEKIFTLFMPLTAGCTVHFGESVYTVQSDLKEVSPTVFLGVPRIWEKVHAGVTLKMKDSSWLKRKTFDFWHARGERIAENRRHGKETIIDKVIFFFAWLFVFRALRERIGLARCRVPVTGAAPVSEHLIEWFHAIGVDILEGYGQTECAGVSHINRPQNVKLGTVGQTLPGIECRIDDDGEILVRGPNVFKGYLNKDEATEETITDEGWLRTGDIGEVDADGFLSITGRKKQIIITAGGKNLSPEKIENALKTSPYIKEAVAIGDQRKFISALVQIDGDSVGDWASRRGIAYTSFEDLTEKEEVVELINKEVKKANEKLARVEQVREVRLFPKELHQDDGEVTATQKVKRSAVMEKYEDLIEDMY